MELKGIQKICVVGVALIGLSACNRVTFAPAELENVAKTEPVSPVPQCSTEIVTKPIPVEVLFVVDQSGSNVNGPFGFPGMSTDALKAFRYGIIADFLEKHGNKQNLRWSFITFNNGGARGLVHNGDPQAPSFTSNPLSIRDAFNAFFASPDVGDTPYRLALRLAEQTIRADRAQKTDDETQYLVAFITDGSPTDYCPGSPVEKECPGRVLEHLIDADVTNLMSAAPGKVNLGTVYYGLADPTAAGRLERMSQIGGGQFVDLNVSSKIDLDDVIEVPQTVCQ